ncbi:hypothetical protein DPM19_10840 [Actinomadura craniellae]|uniref:Uncharacterized protein n=1 Tax=Actinomadura craniellae TaxID=2231787 RepID=A0A365H7Z3_9ACTN|nr:hypothetical protein [Actinomadura craniellae]RAY15207.1 hypothetical protein DPM19_10840 [Actinomadura craniellae]
MNTDRPGPLDPTPHGGLVERARPTDNPDPAENSKPLTPLVPVVRGWACDQCGGGGLNSAGHTCPGCDGAGHT